MKGIQRGIKRNIKEKNSRVINIKNKNTINM